MFVTDPSSASRNEAQNLEAFIPENPPAKSSSPRRKGKGARLTDTELLAQLAQRPEALLAVSGHLGLTSKPSDEELVLSARDEHSLPLKEGYDQLFNPGANPYTPHREVILPLLLDPVSRGRVFLATPRLGGPRARGISVGCSDVSPLQPFQTFMDPRLNASPSFVRVFGGVLEGDSIREYYLKAAHLGSVKVHLEKRNPVVELSQWGRRSQMSLVTLERAGTHLPVFSFNKGYDLGQISSSGASSWRVSAFVAYLNHSARDVIVSSSKDSEDPVEWHELRSLSYLASKNPTIELMAALLKFSAAI